MAVIITAGCVQSGPAPSKITPTPTILSCDNWVNPTKCNGICYNSYENDCCGGTIYPHDSNQYSAGTCCGERWYPKNNSKGETGTCCAGKMYVGSGECCPNPEYNFYYHPAWRDYEQVWINTDTQHCCAGKVAQGRQMDFVDCGEDTCINQNTQSCCFERYDQDKNKYIYTVHQGAGSCCIGKPTPPPGMYCNKDTGIQYKTGNFDPINPLHPDRGW